MSAGRASSRTMKKMWLAPAVSGRVSLAMWMPETASGRRHEAETAQLPQSTRPVAPSVRQAGWSAQAPTARSRTSRAPAPP